MFWGDFVFFHQPKKMSDEAAKKVTDSEDFDSSATAAPEGSANWRDILEEIYTGVGGPGAFVSTPHKLQKVLRDNHEQFVSLKQISNWLEDKYSHSLHRSARTNFKRNQIIATDIDEQWQGDLFFIDEFRQTNRGFRCGLVIIDVVSRYAWAELMKNKTGPATTDAFEKILRRASPRKPIRLQTDKGTEFLNQKFQNCLRQNKIDFFTSYSDHKAAIAERFNKTLKDIIYKYLDENNTNIYYDKFQDIVKSYNETYHGTIKMAPSSVNRGNVGEVLGTLYGHLWKSGDLYGKRKIKFKVNDYVRLSKIHTDIFKKGYKGRWSEEIFQIASLKNTFPYVTYGVKDLKGKEVLGSFYEQEIQKVPRIDMRTQYWKIEKIIKTRKGASGRRESLVKWVGYDDSFNSWVPDSDLKSIKKK